MRRWILPSNWQGNICWGLWKAITQIHHHLRQGDTYQVNYTVQLQTEFKCQSFCYLQSHGEWAGGRLQCLWWTWRHGGNFHESRILLNKIIVNWRLVLWEGTTKPWSWLMLKTWKGQPGSGHDLNRSENMMVVDLLRNDMNRLSEVGSSMWRVLPSGTVFNS